MGISEKKMQIVINNYFKQECDVNTSIREAFEKGFRIGVKKASSAQPEIIRCKDCENWDTTWQNDWLGKNYHYCPLIDVTRNGDFYCADAERRTDETD